MKTTMLLTAALATVVTGNTVDAQVRVQTGPGGFAFVTGDPDRPMIGVSTRGSGKRDTLGLLVESVTRDGPADKAGVEEGDRLGAGSWRRSPAFPVIAPFWAFHWAGPGAAATPRASWSWASPMTALRRRQAS